MSDITMEVARRTGAHLEVTPSELAGWVFDGPAPLLLDVRDPSEWSSAHIPGSECAPLRRSWELVGRIPDDGLVVLVDDDGARSREATRLLGICGFRQVAYLRGGLKAWMESGYPIGA